MAPCFRKLLLLSVGLLACALAGTARADDVHLEGGTVIEGKVTRSGDKVTIELESGQITLSADSVRRIDKRESNVERYERMRAELKPGDVSGRLALANFCRDHEMRGREQELLREIIDRAPDHAHARQRLGYVKDDSGGWITREEQYRARGMVQRDGVWMTSERALELARLEQETRTAQRERERAEAQLEAERRAQERQAQLDEQRAAQSQRYAPTDPYFVAPYGYGYGYGLGYSGYRESPARRGFRDVSDHRSPPPFESEGVRRLRDPGFAMPGVSRPRTR
jgi:hypothetical protein